MSMQQWNEEDDFFNRLIFGDESTFHLSGKVNKQRAYMGNRKPKGTGAACAGFTKS